jgi:16S rRNA (cytidine1402-2'-O)-methyltransferase
MSKIFIIGTPIGNLDDISARALKTLKEVDFILCEDTRVTRKLLNYYEIHTASISYHQHSKVKKIDYILELLNQGKNLALVSDAGTPGISDPGNKLIQEAIELLGDQVKIIPIPGPSAVTTIASIAGCSMDRFIFLGFPPKKRKRKKFFQEMINTKYPIIFYESCHRILKTLEELRRLDDSLQLVVGRELTKKFETIYRGKVDKVIENIKKDKIKGEFVIVVKNDD